jgi:hypothetical protein
MAGAVSTSNAMNATTPAGPPRHLPTVPKRRRLRDRVDAGSAVTVAVAGGALALALANGATDLTARSVAAILALWTILLAVAFDVWPRERPPRAAIACGALLAGFTALNALSLLWTPAAERTFAELDRAALYTALVALAVLAARRGDGRRWADGLAAAIGIVALLAVSQRLLPGVLPAGDIPRLLPAAASRLSYPIGYWNGLALLLALGVPLLLRIAVSDARVAWRAAAMVPLPALALAIYLTSSRGGAAAGSVALLVFVACTARRFGVLQALLVAGVGAALALSVVRGHPALVDGVPGSPAAEDEGPGVAALVAVICLATGAAWALLSAVLPRRLQLARGVSVAIAAAAALLALAAVVAADPGERLRTFKAAPTNEGSAEGFVQDHLTSSSGSGRWQFWEAALDQFADHPVRGQGPGTYEAWWAQNGTLDLFIRNAHSLWLETLGELGLVGLLLLAGAFLVALVAGAGRLRGRTDEERTVVAALLGVVAAFVVGAGIDWIWQVPVIAGVALVATGLLVGPATHGAAPRGEPAPPLRFGTRALVVAIAWVALIAQAIPLLSVVEVRASQEAAADGDLRGAEEHAAGARSIQPWAATPHLQLALVREQRGDLTGARRHASDAVTRDRLDWRLRVVQARLATKDGDIPAARRALREARRLNPRSPALRR